MCKWTRPFSLLVPVSVHRSALSVTTLWVPPGTLRTQTHCRVAAQWTVLVLRQKLNLCWWKLNRHTHAHTHTFTVYLPLKYAHKFPSRQSFITLDELTKASQHYWYIPCKHTHKILRLDLTTSWLLELHKNLASPDQTAHEGQTQPFAFLQKPLEKCCC